ncbi:isoprenylcysteine carboxylmethyltransferase family protein [Bergeyella cardium]
MLFYVIYQLGSVWTLKIYILKNHKIKTSFLFRYVKHPNYYLNIIPELIGIALLCRANISFGILFPIYLIILGIRIYQEERAMKNLY